MVRYMYCGIKNVGGEVDNLYLIKSHHDTGYKIYNPVYMHTLDTQDQFVRGYEIISNLLQSHGQRGRGGGAGGQLPPQATSTIAGASKLIVFITHIKSITYCSVYYLEHSHMQLQLASQLQPPSSLHKLAEPTDRSTEILLHVGE